MRIRPGALMAVTVIAAMVLAAVLALRPAPVLIETGVVATGPLQATTEDQAETRSHDRYVVASPVSGRLLRVWLRDGDAVKSGDAVAMLAPVPLTEREQSEARARVDAAAATQRAADAQLAHALEDLEQGRRERTRLEQLFARSLASAQQLEQARNAAVTLEMEAQAARNRAGAAAADLRGARAALSAATGAQLGNSAPIQVRAPASGRILRILEASERVIPPGTPILIIGDLAHLEIVMEMLSSEAVKVRAGMPAVLLGWGGDRPLRARVRLVEPYAFTKVSALGVEEKRTNVILDFADPPGALGDGYRLWVRIVLWESDRVLKAPLSAAFRCGEDWCAFAVHAGRAQLRHIGIGHRNDTEVEVLSGLAPGEQVIRHPPNELSDGARVRIAPSAT